VAGIGTLGRNVQGVVVFDVRVDLDETDLELRPFMTAAVDIVVMQIDDALLVPNSALSRDASGRYVEVVSGGSMVRVPVEIGATNVEYSIVQEGLEEGDEVVVSRPRGLLDSFGVGGNAD
jgi:multidrug efflux pump subunit AcrA (membrane-fusion protein)